MSEAARIEEIPPLMAGDRLTRAEFERRYFASPHIKKAELIEGIVYVASPLSSFHGDAHMTLGLWLATWAAGRGAIVSDNTTFRIDDLNEPQPDLSLRLDGDTAVPDEDGYLVGVPTLIVEVAYTSTSYDLHQKKGVYQRHGIPTYIVWRIRDKKLSWFELVEGRYIEKKADADGIFRSERLPGLWIDSQAIAANDYQRVIGLLAQARGAPPQ